MLLQLRFMASVIVVFLFLAHCMKACTPSMFLDDAHVFDNLFFNTTDEENNETGTLAPTLTSTTSPIAVDTITSAPLLFSLQALPKLFGFGRSKWMPFGKHADFSPKLLTNPTWRIKGSPPVSWTYCFPLCGSGDQALDAEDAIDNVNADITAALTEAMTTLNLAVLTDDQIKIRYTPKNTVLEEFGDYYDKTGTRYRVVRGSVRYSYTRQTPGNFTEYIEEIDISIKSSPAYTESLWKNVANEIANFLTNERYMFIKSKPMLVSYSASQKPLFFF